MPPQAHRAALVATLLLALFPAIASPFVPVAREGDALDAPPLVDMNGRAVATRRGVLVLSFIYTRCADAAMCPSVTAKFRQLSTLLAGTQIGLLEVTLDPGTDTPAVLRRYGHAAGADGSRWTFATGEPGSLAAFAARAGLLINRPRPGTIAHTETVLISRDGILARSVPGNAWTPVELAAEARAVAALPADPLSRLLLRAFGELATWCGVSGANGVTPGIVALTFLATLAAIGYLTLRLLRAVLAGR